MVFSSTEFLFLFFPALLVLYYFPGLNHRIYRNTVLLLASLFFYAWGEPAFVFVMLISVFVNWLIGIIMDNQTKHKNRKCWLVFAIAFDVFLLAVFKYASFASENLAALTGNDKLIINVALPIGISFFTFQMMSYVFDIYYGSVCAQKNPLYVALYVSLFPQLIAGPIVRYQQIEMEITDRHETMEHVSSGLRRFIYGLGKKVLLANFLAQIADNIFGFLSASSVMMAWLGAISYTLQIYFDFSGYSDMAIGLGEMFGFHFLENFNYPYISKSVTEFWRRWHISLSTWFRDYVYIPLGGGRVKKSRWVLNLFVVWLLTGIWHGANWTFVLWGLFYFFILLIEKLTGVAESDKLRGAVFSHVYTMLVVIIGWVIFRANDVVSGISYIGTMFGIGIADFIDLGFIEYIKNAAFLLLAALVGCTPLVNNNAGVYGITDFSNQNADDFLAKISSAGVETLDLRETALEEGLTRSDLFYRTDHHWRAETGLWASRHVLKILKEKYGDDIDALSLNSNCFTHVEYSEWFLGSQGKKVTLARTVPDDFVLLYPKYQTKLHYEIPSLGIDAVGDLSVTYDMSHVEKKDYYNQNAYVAYNHGDQALIKIENMLNAGNLKLLILHDSFAGCVVPFVALGVKQVDALDLRHYTGSVQAYIEDTSPDAVIVMNSAELIHGAVDWSSHKDLFDCKRHFKDTWKMCRRHERITQSKE